jgi:hypothetical protein
LTSPVLELRWLVLKAARLTIVLLVALSLGLHWAFLQTVAWTSMLVRYSQENDLGKAVSMTFDGEHPCPLCKAVEEGRAQEKKKEQQQTKPLKIDFALIWNAPVPEGPRAYPQVIPETQSSFERSFAPPKPPPRA